jgi:hypothetical protein
LSLVENLVSYITPCLYIVHVSNKIHLYFSTSYIQLFLAFVQPPKFIGSVSFLFVHYYGVILGYYYLELAPKIATSSDTRDYAYLFDNTMVFTDLLYLIRNLLFDIIQFYISILLIMILDNSHRRQTL